MPDFRLAPLPNGRPLLASADVRGRVTMINVFGSWCISCAAEHPMLMNFSRENSVPIYGVDWRDEPGQGVAWLERYGDPYARVGLDADSRLAIDLGVTGAPETYIIDAGGRIRYKQIGPITPEIWRETLQPIIRELEAKDQ